MLKQMFVVSFLLLTSLPVLAEVADADAKALEGIWKPMSAELAGQALPEAVLKMITLKMRGGRYEVLVGERMDKGTYAVDTDTKPKGITVVGKEGPNQGKTFPAIYELDGNTLRVCYDLSGKARPNEFKTNPATQTYLVTYTRQKEE